MSVQRRDKNKEINLKMDRKYKVSPSWYTEKRWPVFVKTSFMSECHNCGFNLSFRLF